MDPTSILLMYKATHKPVGASKVLTCARLRIGNGHYSYMAGQVHG